jgi:hypothetical protein
MKAKQGKFKPGRAGIEGRLYLIRGYHSTTGRTDEEGKPAPMDVLRVAADNLNDVVEHLKRFESQFDVYCIKLVGMMRLVSGTPYWG